MIGPGRGAGSAGTFRLGSAPPWILRSGALVSLVPFYHHRPRHGKEIRHSPIEFDPLRVARMSHSSYLTTQAPVGSLHGIAEFLQRGNQLKQRRQLVRHQKHMLRTTFTAANVKSRGERLDHVNGFR